MQLKDYFEKLGKDGFSVGFKYDQDNMRLIARLSRDGKSVDCIIDRSDLTDDRVMIKKIRDALKNF